MSLTNFDLQPTLENELILVRPLKESDFEALFKVASDPLIWEQHPAKEHSQREGFTAFFNEAMSFESSFVVIDKKTNEIIGSTRYRTAEGLQNAIEIGWTFLARAYWGGYYNKSLKELMMDYAFQHVTYALFYIHEDNLRSQKAVEKLGGKRITELAGHVLQPKSTASVIYVIDKPLK